MYYHLSYNISSYYNLYVNEHFDRFSPQLPSVEIWIKLQNKTLYKPLVMNNFNLLEMNLLW